MYRSDFDICSVAQRKRVGLITQRSSDRNRVEQILFSHNQLLLRTTHEISLGSIFKYFEVLEGRIDSLQLRLALTAQTAWLDC